MTQGASASSPVAGGRHSPTSCFATWPPRDLVAMALPRLATYLNLEAAIAGSLNTVHVAVVFVAETGEVEAVGEAGRVLG